MKAIRFWMALLAVVTITAGAARAADVDLVVNALPASLLIDMNGSKFAATDVNGNRASMSQVMAMPSIAAGVGFQQDAAYVDLTVGAGVLVNDSFRSFMFQLVASGTLELSESLNIGPRVGLVQFVDPEWLEDDDAVDFDEDTGFLIGLGIEMGDRIKYLVAVDYIDATFDAEGAAGADISDDSFDLSGLAIQFGVRGMF